MSESLKGLVALLFTLILCEGVAIIELFKIVFTLSTEIDKKQDKT